MSEQGKRAFKKEPAVTEENALPLGANVIGPLAMAMLGDNPEANATIRIPSLGITADRHPNNPNATDTQPL